MHAPSLPEGYKVVRKLGEGYSGAVYLAQQRDLKRPVALKLLTMNARDPRELRLGRFAEEARLLVEHPHPCLVPLLDFDLEAESPYLAFAFMPGGDLTRVPTPLAVSRVAHLGARLARGLHHLHERDVLHRDVKPANVLLDADGEPYLADLGLGREGEGRGLTETGALVGTLRYLSREIFEGLPASPASDLYALAVMCAELLLGTRAGPTYEGNPPFPDEQIEELEPPELRELLRRGMRPYPEDRPGSCAEFAEALEEIATRTPGEHTMDLSHLELPAGVDAATQSLPAEASSIPSSAPAPPRSEVTGSGSRTGALGIRVGLAAGLAFLAGAALLRPPPPPDPAPLPAPAAPAPTRAARPAPRPAFPRVGLPPWPVAASCDVPFTPVPATHPRKTGIEFAYLRGNLGLFGRVGDAAHRLEFAWPSCGPVTPAPFALAAEATRLPTDAQLRARALDPDGPSFEVILDHPSDERKEELRGVWLSTDLYPDRVPPPGTRMALEVIPAGPPRRLTARVKALRVLAGDSLPGPLRELSSGNPR